MLNEAQIFFPNFACHMRSYTRAADVLSGMHGIEPNTISNSSYVVDTKDVIRHVHAHGSNPPRVRKTPIIFPRSAETIRPYQSDAANAMRSSNALLVAPCGSGKTLIGLLTASMNGGRFLVLTSRYCRQWYDTMQHFFFADPGLAVVVVGEESSDRSIPDVVISTYNAFYAGKNDERMQLLRHLHYDTIVLDEAHTAASSTYFALVSSLYATHKCALTATNVREDDEMKKLNRFINGKIHHIDRLSLVSLGHIPDVHVVKLLVPAHPMHMETLKNLVGQQRALAILPHKVQVLLSTLTTMVLSENRKVIVFCDDHFCIYWVSRVIQMQSSVKVVGVITMKMEEDTRTTVLKKFSSSVEPCCIMLSRTGDEAIDIPTANAGIVFWNGWGSRRQIVQRIGRISRPSDHALLPTFVVILCEHESELRIDSHRDTYLKEHQYTITRYNQHESHYGTPLRNNCTKYIARLKSHFRSNAPHLL